MVSSTLAVYNITAPVDEQGQSVKLKADVTTGLLSCIPDLSSYPVPFECNIKPRSATSKTLILDSLNQDY